MGKSITIRDVPEEVHAELVRRAGFHGQSLQQFLNALLQHTTDHADMKELMARVRERLDRGGGTNLGAEKIVEMIHQDRAEREEHLASLLIRPSSSRH